MSRQTASFARPSSGGAATFTLSRSPSQPTISSRRLPGTTFTPSVVWSGVPGGDFRDWGFWDAMRVQSIIPAPATHFLRMNLVKGLVQMQSVGRVGGRGSTCGNGKENRSDVNNRLGQFLRPFVGRAIGQAVGVAFALLAAAGIARAQLTPSQVLVVYDSRIPESLAVAEYYAGSAKVPGGVGSLPGKRPGVRAVNLNSLGAAVTTPGNIDYPSFASRLRDPIRTHLTSNNLVGSVRCIVLTKGLPHRIFDTDNTNVGDNPSLAATETTSLGDYTAASVDSELTLLFLGLDTGEAGGNADSKADGMVLNPYWKSNQSISHFNANFAKVSKTLANTNASGPIWASATATAMPNRLLAGDIMLVCRLDGPTVQVVKDSLDRAQNIIANVNTAAILFDKDPAQLDNANAPFTSLYAGNDYDLSRNYFTTDGRFPTNASPTIPAPGVNYNAIAGFDNFYVGPLLSWAAGTAPIVNQPVLFLAHYGSNHNGFSITTGGTPASTIYATSFNYAPGAIFNTIESYNGRDFGGLGLGGTPQQQASSFLASGGTFAVGHVWEPFANTLADNLYLTQNFVLGGLTWAEAAWSSIPTLSWMHVVLGDPLARMDRSSEDLNADGVINLEDLIRWEQLPTNDPLRNLNRDANITTADRNLLTRTLRQGERASLVGGRP